MACTITDDHGEAVIVKTLTERPHDANALVDPVPRCGHRHVPIGGQPDLASVRA